jgi:hypothetical protein
MSEAFHGIDWSPQNQPQKISKAEQDTTRRAALKIVQQDLHKLAEMQQEAIETTGRDPLPPGGYEAVMAYTEEIGKMETGEQIKLYRPKIIELLKIMLEAMKRREVIPLKMVKSTLLIMDEPTNPQNKRNSAEGIRSLGDTLH